MNKYHGLLLLILGCFASGIVAAQTLPLGNDSTIEFASVEAGQKILSEKDDYTSRLSKFDLAVILKGSDDLGEQQIIDRNKESILPWASEEIERFASFINKASSKLKNYPLNLPEKLYLVKTSGKESLTAPYTRHNAIVIHENMPQSYLDNFEHLLLHEIFHIFSRYNVNLRDGLYSLIGFEKCSDLVFPMSMKDLILTNPDAPTNEYYIELTNDNEKIDVIPIVYSNSKNYAEINATNLLGHATFSFIEVEVKEGRCACKLKDGEPVLYNPGEVQGYSEKIGSNTDYIISPEEIMAENFAFMVAEPPDLKTPELITSLKNYLNQVEAANK